MHSLVLVAGGKGSRFGEEIPKQFIPLCGKPILMRTMERFFDFDPSLEIILVLPSMHMMYWKDLCQTYHFDLPHRMVEGGETRFHSVRNGLAMIQREGIVGIHDAVRPFVSKNLLKTLYTTAEKRGSAIPAVPPVDSVRQTQEEGMSTSLNRDTIRLIQTPQCFQTSRIQKAYTQAYRTEFTDDTSVFESNGEKIHLVEGDRINIKITTPIDLVIAEKLWAAQTQERL